MNLNPSKPEKPVCRIWKSSNNVGSDVNEVVLQTAPSNLDEACILLPAGAYTTLCTFDGKYTLRLEDHMRRLIESALLTGKVLTIPRQVATRLILIALEAFSPKDIRVRLIADLSQSVGDLYLAAIPYDPPPDCLYTDGISVVSRLSSRQNPLAKLTNYITEGSAIRSDVKEQAYEALLVNSQGDLLEGTSCNFYAIKEGALWTASEGVLLGITRSLVLDEAIKAGIRVYLSGVNINQIDQIEEAFITSSTRGIIPVRTIDGLQIGTSVPGPMTSRLMSQYTRRLRQELVPLSESREASSSPASGPSTSSPRS